MRALQYVPAVSIAVAYANALLAIFAGVRLVRRADIFNTAMWVSCLLG